jgi:threonine dehydrogenase-like Zn-dependent dehydrogenase
MTPRRSAGKIHVARAIWYAKPGVVELRTAPLPALAPGNVLVRTHFSGVSRGTERLILGGRVPESEHARMRAPMQDGAFPFPVKYGYCAAGVVEDGPKELVGRGVFCLHPHQDVFQAPVGMVVPVPDGIPLRRATLAANMETALNALWDSGAGPADRIVVVGAGIVGLLVAYLAARLPGTEVTVIDPLQERRALAKMLGAYFSSPLAGEVAPSAGGGALLAAGSPQGSREQPERATPTPAPPRKGEGTPSASPAPSGRLADRESEGATKDADVAFHTSATEAGLATAIAAAGMEATIVELSWYGDKQITLPLGGAFHSQRLRLVSSQVGQVAASRRPRWTYRRRLEAALGLLADDRLDALLTTEIAFEDAPAKLPQLLAADAPGLAPLIRYSIAGA